MLLAWGYHPSCVKGWLPNGLKLWASTVPVLGHARASNLLYVQLVLSGHFSTRLNFFGILKLSSQFCFSVMYSQGETFWLSFLPYWVVCSISTFRHEAHRSELLDCTILHEQLHENTLLSSTALKVQFLSVWHWQGILLDVLVTSFSAGVNFLICEKSHQEKKWGEYWS